MESETIIPTIIFIIPFLAFDIPKMLLQKPLAILEAPIPKWNKFEGMTQETHERLMDKYQNTQSILFIEYLFWISFYIFDVWFVLYSLEILSSPLEFLRSDPYYIASSISFSFSAGILYAILKILNWQNSD